MTVVDLSPHSFVAVGIVLPLSYEGDGTIIDANGTVACQVDPNNELPDARVARIAELILHAVNWITGDDDA